MQKNSLQILSWDSDFFGYKVGKVIAAAISPETLEAIKHEAIKNNVKLLYLFTDPLDSISTTTANNDKAKLVDQKVTFHTKIKAIDSLVDEHIVEYEKDFPSEQLISLALQSGLYSRYKVDEKFTNNEFERLYLAWIENSVNKKIADHTFIYKEEGKELGFVTLKARDNYGQIGLIAVDETSRGKSIGKKLILGVIDMLEKKNIPDLDVATQVDNEDACNFYKKVGFTATKTENIYHIWL